MKNIVSSAIIAILLVVLLNACKKQNIDPLSQLPPATQTGQETFGCLVNGKAFVLQNQSILQGPEFSFGYNYGSNNSNTILVVSNSSNSDYPGGFGFTLDSLNLVEGNTYILSIPNKSGFASAACSFLDPNNGYYTNANVTGSLTITKNSLEVVNGGKYLVTSGTFYFNAVDAKGDTVKVTNGRFDLPH